MGGGKQLTCYVDASQNNNNFTVLPLSKAIYSRVFSRVGDPCLCFRLKLWNYLFAWHEFSFHVITINVVAIFKKNIKRIWLDRKSNGEYETVKDQPPVSMPTKLHFSLTEIILTQQAPFVRQTFTDTGHIAMYVSMFLFDVRCSHVHLRAVITGCGDLTNIYRSMWDEK